MRYCGHFLIKAEGGAKNYKRDYPLPLAWRPFTVVFVERKGYRYVRHTLVTRSWCYVMMEELSVSYYEYIVTIGNGTNNDFQRKVVLPVS